MGEKICDTENVCLMINVCSIILEKSDRQFDSKLRRLFMWKALDGDLLCEKWKEILVGRTVCLKSAEIVNFFR